MNDAAIPVARRTARRNTGSFMCWEGPSFGSEVLMDATSKRGLCAIS